MNQATYLIAGSSHAAIEAVAAIRMADPEGAVVMATADSRLPYSPTILPYVVKGWTPPERAVLRDEAWLAAQKVRFLPESPLAEVCPDRQEVRLADGAVWYYDKLLLATGARPALPPIPGLDRQPHHVLRTVDDALALKGAIAKAKRAVVLGAGLVGLHAAETMRKAGLAVTVVEQQPRVLSGYFDQEASDFIAQAFVEQSVDMVLNDTATAVEAEVGGFRLQLASGADRHGDLLLVATGVRPVTDFLKGSGIELGKGIVVDAGMRTSAANVWAAGDVAEVPQFLDGKRGLAGILPNAVEQGRIAGAAMAGDRVVKPFPGAIPLNTFGFFGNNAVAVGAASEEGATVEVSRDGRRYLRLVLAEGRLRAISAINHEVDAGLMWQLILRRVDLRPLLPDFLARPHETGRVLMSRLWR